MTDDEKKRRFWKVGDGLVRCNLSCLAPGYLPTHTTEVGGRPHVCLAPGSYLMGDNGKMQEDTLAVKGRQCVTPVVNP